MAWYTSIVKTLIPAIGEKIVGIGKQAVEDAVDVVEDAGKEIREELIGEITLENITFSYINDLSADELQYLANKISVMRDTVLRVERYVGSTAKLRYSYNIKVDLTDDQVEKVEAFIKNLKSQDENSYNRG